MDAEALELLRRGSGIALTWDGTFTYLGSPVANTRVQGLFHRSLRVREDGEVVIEVGGMWAYVRCDGVASFVDRLLARRGQLELRLRSGEVVRVEACRLGSSPLGRIYAWPLPTGRPALVSRRAAQELEAWLVEDGSGHVWLESGGLRLQVTALAREPTAASDDISCL